MGDEERVKEVEREEESVRNSHIFNDVFFFVGSNQV